MISLSSRRCVKIVNTVGVPQYGKFRCTKSHFEGSSDETAKQYGMQPQLLKGEINHSEILKYKYKELRHIGEPDLKSDVLCLANIYTKHASDLEKMTKIGVREALTETSLVMKNFGLKNEDREFCTLKNKYDRDFIHSSTKVDGVCA